MIKAANNIFLDVNDATIIIEENNNSNILLRKILAECANVNKSTGLIYSFLFYGTVTFTATGPEGSTVISPSE
jgi:hypothetical protein